MKRTIVAWAGVIALVTVAGVAYVYWQNSMKADAQNAKSNGESQKEVAKTAAPSNTSTPVQPGVFTDYQEGLVASTDGIQLLFFHAPWCPQCRMIEADIKKQGVPDGVTILKVDYDSNQALRQKYGVTLQTTFVEVDKAGNELDKYVAYNEPNFDSVKNNLFNK